jgi:gluconate 2-dehydrogenase gamma chain
MAAWPEVLAARQHAHTAAHSSAAHFETLDADTAAEIEALTAQIIPSVGGPGAREAGVIYFIDRALATFAAADAEAYRSGLTAVQKTRMELFPNSAAIASLSNHQQITLMGAIETTSFFDLLRTHTVLGFLGDPRYGGNREKVGWRAIGFEDRMVHQHPFGYYDALQEGK